MILSASVLCHIIDFSVISDEKSDGMEKSVYGKVCGYIVKRK